MKYIALIKTLEKGIQMGIIPTTYSVVSFISLFSDTPSVEIEIREDPESLLPDFNITLPLYAQREKIEALYSNEFAKARFLYSVEKEVIKCITAFIIDYLATDACYYFILDEPITDWAFFANQELDKADLIQPIGEEVPVKLAADAASGVAR